jgi:pantothenate kinase
VAPEHPRDVAASQVADWICEHADPSRRFLFGIAGPPGSGKSTLAADVGRQLDAVIVPMDGFHLPNATLDARGLRAVKGAPETFDADAFVAAVRRLAAADEDVRLPDFDRGVDEPVSDRIVVRAVDAIVIVEGNYLLLDSEPWVSLRTTFDAVGHLDVDPRLRIERLVDRHVRFGRSRAEAAAFVEASDEVNATLVEAVRHRAHLIIRS